MSGSSAERLHLVCNTMTGKYNSNTLPKQVIVLEQRSLLNQFGGIWYLAIPVVIAFWFCLPRHEVEEESSAKLNLPDTNWWQVTQGTTQPDSETISLEQSNLTVASTTNPNSVTNQTPQVKSENTSDSVSLTEEKAQEPISEITEKSVVPTTDIDAESKLQAASNDSQKPVEVASGVVIPDQQRMNLNPVAVFDPDQSAAEIEARQSKKSTVKQAELFGNPQPNQNADESDQIIAEIEKQAAENRSKIEQDQTLKPLLALHEEAQAKQRAIEFQESLKRRAETTREPFQRSLASILNINSTVNERGDAITNLIQNDLANIDARIFQPVLNKLETPGRSISTASKIRWLRSQFIPESIILSYLIQLEMRDLGKTNGPRNSNDAKVQSARLLLRISN